VGFSVCPEKNLKVWTDPILVLNAKKFCFQTLWRVYDNFGAGDGQQAFYPGQMSCFPR